MFCIQCGQQMNEESLFCSNCGAKSPASEDTTENSIFCTQCGVKLPDDATFCTDCGTQVAETPVSETPVIEEPPAVETKTNDSSKMPPSDLDPEVEAPRETQDSGPWEESQDTDAAPDRQRQLVIILGGAAVALLAVVIGLVVFIIIGRDNNSDVGDPNGGYVPTQNIAYQPDNDEDSDDNFIAMIEHGHLADFQDVTIGAAMERFFDTPPEWNHFSDGAENYVSVHGDMMHENEVVTAQFMFQFTHDGQSFNPINLIIDGVWQDVVLMAELLEYIMESARR